jgi:hypothetical protein
MDLNNMENKQTALEWFTNEIILFGSIKIDSSGKEFIQFNYSLYHKVLLEAKQMEKEQTTEKTNTNNNIQTKTRWSDTERWIAAVIATLGTFGFIYWLYTIGYLLHFGIYTFLTWLVIMIVFLVKHLIDELIDGR